MCKQQNLALFKAGVLGSVRKTRRPGNSGATELGPALVNLLDLSRKIGGDSGLPSREPARRARMKPLVVVQANALLSSAPRRRTCRQSCSSRCSALHFSMAAPISSKRFALSLSLRRKAFSSTLRELPRTLCATEATSELCL